MRAGLFSTQFLSWPLIIFIIKLHSKQRKSSRANYFFFVKKLNTMKLFAIIALIFCLKLINKAECLQCYQCNSEEDDFCPAFGYFDETKNALVDCYGLESATPGHMCVKISKSSPDTLYGNT